MSYDKDEVMKHNSLFSNNFFNVGNKIHRNVLLSCDHGLMIVNRFDYDSNGVGHAQWLLDHGNVSTVEALYCHDLLKEISSPIIFDIGANIGTFTTWMAKAFPKGKVYSFEPQREVFQILCGNAAINNLYNVYAHNIGLGSNNCFIEFNEADYFKPCDFGTFTLNTNKYVERNKNSISVQIMTLDSFVETFKVKKIDLLKIDVEGMDVEVLIGASKTIKKYYPIIFIEHSNNVESKLDEIKKFLDQFEYNYTVIENNVLCKPQ